MNKEKQYVTIAAMVTILVGLIIAIFLLTSQKNSGSSNDTAKQQTSQVKRDPKLDQMTLPQLNTTIADDESEVRLVTTAGDITLKLFNRYAPLAVENFISHAKAGYYNNTTFHRVLADFMIQGGDPQGTGKGGESIWHNKDKNIDSGQGFKNEISSSLYNIRGALSMANAGPNTNGSQFFINQNKQDQSQKLNTNQYPKKIVAAYKNGGNPSLDGSYTVFGQVISGMAVVDNIASAKVKSEGEGSTPIDPIKIKNIVILKEAK